MSNTYKNLTEKWAPVLNEESAGKIDDFTTGPAPNQRFHALFVIHDFSKIDIICYKAGGWWVILSGRE